MAHVRSCENLSHIAARRPHTLIILSLHAEYKKNKHDLKRRSKPGGQLPRHMPSWMARSGQSQWACLHFSWYWGHKRSCPPSRKPGERVALGHQNVVGSWKDSLEGCEGNLPLPSFAEVPPQWSFCRCHPNPQVWWWGEFGRPSQGTSGCLPSSAGLWRPLAFPHPHLCRTGPSWRLPWSCRATWQGRIGYYCSSL